MLHWIKITEKLPEENKPVFLIKNEDDGIGNADVGYLLTSDNGEEKGFFVDSGMKVLKLHARSSWMYIEEKTFFVPDRPDDELEPTVLVFLSKLRFYDDKFRKLSFWMIKSGKGLYPLDFYVSGIVSRSLSLIYGFETLIMSRNYIAAVHLIRPHLDNYMRLNAAWLAENPHDFANKVWEGEQVSNIKDKDGKLMKDWYLKNKATERHPWMKEVYSETSGFIHFSNKHIKNAISLSKDQYRVLEASLGKTDNNISNKNKLEAIMCMIETCNAIADAIFGWIDTKRIKG